MQRKEIQRGDLFTTILEKERGLSSRERDL